LMKFPNQDFLASLDGAEAVMTELWCLVYSFHPPTQGWESRALTQGRAGQALPSTLTKPKAGPNPPPD
jgi:hypothetical protein